MTTARDRQPALQLGAQRHPTRTRTALTAAGQHGNTGTHGQSEITASTVSARRRCPSSDGCTSCGSTRPAVTALPPDVADAVRKAENASATVAPFAVATAVIAP